MLSNATTGSDLAKLLKVATNLDRQDVAHKAIEYILKPQRMAEMSNSELTEVLTSLILVKFRDQTWTSAKDLTKLMRTIEYVILRRVHSFSTVELSKIIQSYCHLMRQKKVQYSEDAEVSQGSTSLIKTIEYKISSKWSVFTAENGDLIGFYHQCKSMNALLEIAGMKNRDSHHEEDLIMQILQPNGIMEMVEKIIYQIELN